MQEENLLPQIHIFCNELGVGIPLNGEWEIVHADILSERKQSIDFLSFNLVIHSVVPAWSSILNWKYYSCAILLHSLTRKCRSFLPEKSLLFITNLKAWETVVCSWMVKSVNLLIGVDEVWKFMQGEFPSTYVLYLFTSVSFLNISAHLKCR